MVALIPVFGFAQTATPVQAGRTAQTVNQKAAVKAPVAKTEVATAPVVLTEEQQHAVWLKNNTHYKSMTTAEQTKTIQELEQKLSYNLNNSEAVHLQREIKWIKELQTAK